MDIEADVIVGADGAASKVRETVGIRTLARKYDHSYLVTVAAPLEKPTSDARHYLAKGKMLGVFPLPTGTYLFYYVRTGTFEALKALGLEPFKTQLVTLAPELAEPLAEVNSWDDFLYMTPQLVRANSWVSDQVALVGDAVHSLEPSLGQGSSLTLQDVTALLLVLDRCFAESDFSANALKVYEEYRRPHTEFIQTMAERTAMLMNTSSRVVEWLRDRSLRNVQKKQASMLLGLEMASGMVQGLGAVEKLRLAGIL